MRKKDPVVLLVGDSREALLKGLVRVLGRSVLHKLNVTLRATHLHLLCCSKKKSEEICSKK